MASIGPVSISTGSLPTRHVSTIRASGRSPSSAARPARISSTAAEPSLICDELPAVCTPPSITGLRPARPSAVVGLMPPSRTTWRISSVGLPSFIEHRRIDLDDLGAEAVFFPRPGGIVLAAQAVGVALFAADAPFLSHQLRALELRRVLVMVLVTRRRCALTLLVARAHRVARHRLDAATDSGIDHAAAHEAVRQCCGLLARPALRIDRRGSYRERETGAQPRGTGDVGCLFAGLTDAAAYELTDPGRVDLRPLHQRGEHVAEQIGGVNAAQVAAAAADGGSNGIDDDDVVVVGVWDPD